MKRTDLCLKGQNTCLLYQECYYLGSLRPQEAFVRGVTPLVIYNLPLVLETCLQTEPDVASAVSTVTLWNKVRCQQLYENMFLNGASPNLNWNASKLCNSVLTRLLLEVGRKLIVIAAKIMSFSVHRDVIIAFILRKLALDGRSAFVKNEGGAADMCSSVYTGLETLLPSPSSSSSAPSSQHSTKHVSCSRV